MNQDEHDLASTFITNITDFKFPILSLGEILSEVRCTMGFLTQFIAYFVMSFNTPLISNHLVDYGYSPVFMGSSMVTASTFYVISMPVVSILTKRMSKKGVLFIGLFCLITGCNISGIDLIENWFSPGLFTIFGISMMGFGVGTALIPIMPEIIEGIESSPRFKNGYDEIILHNHLAGYFICCQALGEALGPLISSLLERGIEFRPAQKALCIGVTLFLIGYLLSCGVYEFFAFKTHVKLSNIQSVKIEETDFEDTETKTADPDDPVIQNKLTNGVTKRQFGHSDAVLNNNNPLL